MYEDIDCETLFLPHESKKSLAKLDKVSYEELNPEYRKEIERIREKVRNAPPKKSFNKDLSGEGILQKI